MANLLEFQRLSNFVSGIVDRKIQSIAMSISGSTGYLRSLISQSQTYAQESLNHANEARESATEADTSAASTLIVWNEFTSTYIGLNAADPARSKQGNAINVGGFYIRQSDGRLRYVSGVDGTGAPIWADATVTADPTSIAAAGAGVFLSLNALTQQAIKGPVTFQNTITGPKVTSWTSQQLATATDVNDRIQTVQNALTAETQRATTAEGSINNSKVSKGGDTMGGALQIMATGDAASLTVRNTNPSGRVYRFNSGDDGRLRIIDDSASAERMYIQPNGNVVVNNGLTVGSYMVSADFVSNRNDGNDPGISLQTASITRWQIRRSVSSARFYVARMNSAGVFIDTPISVNENDGSVTLNRTTIVDTLSTRGNIRVDAVGAALILNNSSGVADPVIGFQHLGYFRWFMGRSPSSGVFYVNRHTDTGSYVDTPFTISEINGWTSVNNLLSRGAVNAQGSMAAPVFYAQANNTGRAIAIGDDAWIGDQNIANGITIRGQGDFNAGYVVFGNSGLRLGCNANDGTLRYNGHAVYHAGNFSVTPSMLGYQYGTTGGIDWSMRPAANGKTYITMSGISQFAAQSDWKTITYPFALEKVIKYDVATVLNVETILADFMIQFSGQPTLTSLRLGCQQWGGSETYPVGGRWSIEGIVA